MKFKHFAGTAIVPTLGRLVLSLAFVTTGLNKLVGWSEFSAADADVLRTLNVTLRPAGATALGADVRIVPAVLLQETPVEEAADEAAKTIDDLKARVDDAKDEAEKVQETLEELEDAVEEAADAPLLDPEGGMEGEQVRDVPAPPTVELEDDPVTAPPADPAGGSGETYSARSMHHITLLCHGRGWPSPQHLALLAATTEFIGGLLLLVGLLSRVWGLGLAIAMGVAVYLTTWKSYLATGPFIVAQGADDFVLFNQVFSQAGLFVLAFGIFLTGPGPLSLDHLLFRRRSRGAEGEIGEIVFDQDASVGDQPSL